MDEELCNLAQRLKNVEHFKRLPLADLITIVASGQVSRFEKGAIIFSEGDPCSGMNVLLSGRVDLYKTGPEGQVTIFSTIRPVIMFNEVAALDGHENPMTAIAVEDAMIWRILYDRFQLLLDRYPQIARGLLGVLARRDRIMLSQYGDLSFRSVTARVAKNFLVISAEGSKPISRSEYSIKKLASQVVTTPEAISRTIKLLSDKKVIEVSRQTIHVVNIGQLQELAQIDF